MALPLIIIVGADKGGVGKTTISRALIDYLKSTNKEVRAFDTEYPAGVLKRFHPDKTEVVDLTKSDDQMKVFDNLSPVTVTLIDVRAGLLSPTLSVLNDIGFFQMAKEGKIKIIVFHVLGSTIASLNEVKATAEIMKNADHFLLKNHTNGAVFFDGINSVAKDIFNTESAPVLDIPKLDERATEYVEAAGLPFAQFIADDSQSMVLRGKVNHWLQQVFVQFNNAKLS